MSEETLFDCEFAAIWYHPETKIIHHRIDRYFHGETYHNFFLAGTQAMEKYHAHKWLSEDQSNVFIEKEDMEWAINDWFPKTVNAGWKYWAIVKPKNLIGQLDIEKLVKQYSAAGITVRYFSDPDEAMQWLIEQ